MRGGKLESDVIMTLHSAARPALGIAGHPGVANLSNEACRHNCKRTRQPAQLLLVEIMANSKASML